MPVGKAHHLEGSLRETEEEVDEYEGRNQDEQRDDKRNWQQEQFEQVLAPVNELSVIVNRAFRSTQCLLPRRISFMMI